MWKFLANLLMITLSLSLVAGSGICQPPPGAKPRSFYVSEAQKIKVGQTTESEVIALLGEPVTRETKYWGPTRILLDKLYYGATPQGGHAVIVLIDENKKVFRLFIRGKEHY
jgi:hypothetical protein